MPQLLLSPESQDNKRLGRANPTVSTFKYALGLGVRTTEYLARTKPSEHLQAHSRTEYQVTGWQAGYKGRSLGEAAPRRI